MALMPVQVQSNVEDKLSFDSELMDDFPENKPVILLFNWLMGLRGLL